jgi:hypothetical protein
MLLTMAVLVLVGLLTTTGMRLLQWRLARWNDDTGAARSAVEVNYVEVNYSD